jgi:hypothetical protein
VKEIHCPKGSLEIVVPTAFPPDNAIAGFVCSLRASTTILRLVACNTVMSLNLSSHVICAPRQNVDGRNTA